MYVFPSEFSHHIPVFTLFDSQEEAQSRNVRTVSLELQLPPAEQVFVFRQFVGLQKTYIFSLYKKVLSGNVQTKAPV